MEGTIKYYTEFLNRYYSEDVLELAKEYPDRTTLTIDFTDISKFDLDLSYQFLRHPDKELKKILVALSDLDPMADLQDGKPANADIAIKNLGKADLIPIHQIGHEHDGKLISIEGLISKIEQVHPKVVKAAFKCRYCEELTKIPQTGDLLMEPVQCENCERKGQFKLVTEESTLLNQKRMIIQDLNEIAKAGHPLSNIPVFLDGWDLIRSVPGVNTQCTITGILRLQRIKDKSIFNPYLDALHIEPIESAIDFSVSEGDKTEFHEIAEKDDFLQVLTDSTAPAILGYPNVKAGLLCSRVSGSENPNLRDFIHVMLCGDPGTAKSYMLMFILKTSPRAQYSAGNSSTVAGLTAAVVKDESSGTGYTAQMGALPRADRGIIGIDEMDKLPSDKFQDLNTSLEHSFIEIHKSGVHQRFNTRCPVIAVGNPKYTRFNDDQPLSKQITIPGDTLSRFDLIFKIQDKPHSVTDKPIMRHIEDQWGTWEDWKEHKNDVQDSPPGGLSLERLGKYLEYAKTFDPRTTPEIRRYIGNYFLTLRLQDPDEAIAVTWRQASGIYRLTKAIAKLRLSNTCTIRDAEMAIQILKESLQALIDPRTGKIDADILIGMGKSQRDRLTQIIMIVQELQGKDGVHSNDIIARAQEMEIEPNDARNALPQLKSNGDIIEVSKGIYKVA